MQNNEQTAGQTAIQKFTYEDQPIGFASGASVMVNATEMAKKFGKSARHWLNNQQTKEFLAELSGLRNLNPTDLVQVKNGGTNQGTWMHEDVALEFARWLSPKFAIWCNDRIKELARDGVAVASDDDAVIAHAMQVLQRRLDERERRINTLEGHVKKMVPLCDYLGAVMTEDKTYTMTETAAFLGFGHVSHFLNWCVAMGILYRQDGRWMPMPDYAMKGYFEERVFRRMVSPTDMEESYYTVVTELGRMMIFNKVKERTDEVLVEKGGAL